MLVVDGTAILNGRPETHTYPGGATQDIVDNNNGSDIKHLMRYNSVPMLGR